MVKKHKFTFISLGCAKNLVDSEEIIGSLIRKGYQLEPEPKRAEIAIINTCAFLQEARREALDTISEMVKWKKSPESKILKIVVVGCLVQYLQRLKLNTNVIPGVDLFIPIEQYGKIPLLLEELLLEKKVEKEKVEKEAVVKEVVVDNSVSYPLQPQKSRFLSSSPHSVYIKIAEGCNNRCAYCLIPLLRGELRSKKMEDILAEVQAVQKLGTKEINLIAQDTTAYGLDLYGKLMLGELLRNLCKLEGIEWIRILYTHPAHITDELLKIIQNEPKICKYLDIPIQHINNKILQLMNRKTNREEIVILYNKIRRLIPGVALRTTVMVGFPGEGEQEFNELLSFLRQHPFERLGAFVFSPEKGAVAFGLPNRVKPETARKRLQQIMKQQKELSRNFNRQLLGREVTVLVDKYDPGRHKAYGRMATQAPEVDGKVIIVGNGSNTGIPPFTLNPGDLLSVKIIGTGAYDLIGEKKK